MKDLLKNKKIKNFAAIAVVILIIAFVVNFFTDSDEEELLKAENKIDDSLESGIEILETLNQLKVVDIDSNFFSRSDFSDLDDFSYSIEEKNVGKNNPFLESSKNFIPEDEDIKNIEDEDALSENQEINSNQQTNPGFGIFNLE